VTALVNHEITRGSRDHMNIAIIGSTDLSRTLAWRLRAAGHDVVVAVGGNRAAAAELAAAAGVRDADVEEALASANVVLLAMPFQQLFALPADLFRDKIIIDAMDYYRNTDDLVDELDDDAVTSAELVARHLPGARVVKISAGMTLLALGAVGVMADDLEPVPVPLAGDDESAKAVVSNLLVDLGVQPVDVGSLADSRMMQPGSIARALMAGKVPWS
jgi:predicted dinucleotide-binding enzyme